MLRYALTLLAMVGFMGISAQGGVIALWTFESSAPTTAGPHAAEVGTGTAIGYHASGATTWSNPVGNGSAKSFSSNNWTTAGDYYQFQVSTVGLHTIEIAFDQTRSSTGPSSWKVAWSNNGASFSDLADYTVPNRTWSSGTRDTQSMYLYALPAGANNQPTLYIRLAIRAAASASGGTSRVDNVEICGVPEPVTVTFLGLGSLLFGLRRRF